jgi:hypothetical protein
MVARGSAAVVARVLAIEVDPLEASLVDAMLAVREPPESVMPSWPPPLTGLRGTLAEPGGRSVFCGTWAGNRDLRGGRASRSCS